MNNDERVARLRQCLAEAFHPSELEVIDDSHLHAGHAGAREGKGHFRVIIVSQAFSGLSPIKRHRLVYAAVGDMMESDIHALNIDARAPSA